MRPGTGLWPAQPCLPLFAGLLPLRSLNIVSSITDINIISNTNNKEIIELEETWFVAVLVFSRVNVKEHDDDEPGVYLVGSIALAPTADICIFWTRRERDAVLEIDSSNVVGAC